MDKAAFIKHIKDSIHRATGKEVSIEAMNIDGSPLSEMPEDVLRTMAAEFIESITNRINSGEDPECPGCPICEPDGDDEAAREKFATDCIKMHNLLNEDTEEATAEYARLAGEHSERMLRALINGAGKVKRLEMQHEVLCEAVKAMIASLIDIRESADADDMRSVKAAVKAVPFGKLAKLLKLI